MPLASYPSGGATKSFFFNSFASPRSKSFASPVGTNMNHNDVNTQEKHHALGQ